MSVKVRVFFGKALRCGLVGNTIENVRQTCQVFYNELSPKKTGFNLIQSRHCAYITYSVKTWFLKNISVAPYAPGPLDSHLDFFLHDTYFFVTSPCSDLSVVLVYANDRLVLGTIIGPLWLQSYDSVK